MAQKDELLSPPTCPWPWPSSTPWSQQTSPHQASWALDLLTWLQAQWQKGQVHERNQSWTLGTSSWEESALMHLGFFVNWNLDAKKERRVNVPLGALKYIYKHWSSSVGRADLHLHSYDQSKTSLLWGVWSVQALNQSVKMPLSRTPLRTHTLASYKLSAPTVLQNTQHSRNRAKCKGLLVGQLEPNHSEEEVLRYLPEKPPTRAHLPQSAMQAFL